MVDSPQRGWSIGKRLFVAALLAVCAALMLLALFSESVVDFSIPPPAGLTVTYEIKRNQQFGTDSDGLEIVTGYTHIIRRVEARQVIEVERNYDVGDHVRLIEAVPTSKAAEQVLKQAKRLRIRWTGEEVHVEWSAGADWNTAGPDVQAMLSLTDFRAPLLPVGKGVRRVGEEWSCSLRALKSAFVGGLIYAPEVGKIRPATIKLVSIVSDPPGRAGRYAVLEASWKDSWTTKSLYDLRNRIVVEHETTINSDRGGIPVRIHATTRATEIRLEPQ